MKNVILALLAILLFGMPCKAQSLVWASALNSSSAVRGWGVARDDSGNVYSTGSCSGTIDLDPGPGVYSVTVAYGISSYVVKQDALGNFVWGKVVGGTTPGSRMDARTIKTDNNGDVIISGFFVETVDCDPGTGIYHISSGSTGCDAFVIKLNSSGSFVWAISIGDVGTDQVNDICIDASNCIFVTGSFQGTVDFDPGSGTYNLTSHGGANVFVLKLSSTGNFLMARHMGGTLAEARGICTDDLGNIYTTGIFFDTADFDPGAGVANLVSSFREVFISKLDSSGNYVWAKQMHNTQGYPAAIAVDRHCNVYNTGYYSGNGNFDPSGTYIMPSSAGSADIYISRLDSNGNFVWAKRIGDTTHFDQPYYIATDTVGRLYISGTFSSTVDFDPGSGVYNMVCRGVYNGFVMGLDTGGNFIWATSFGCRWYSPARGITTDKGGGNIFVTGDFMDTVDFDPGTGTFNLVANTSGYGNSFVERLFTCIDVNPTLHIQVSPDSNILSGQTVTLTTAITRGGSSPVYQWYINGHIVTGATSSTYITNSLTDADTVTCIMVSSDTCITSPTVHSNPIVFHVSAGLNPLINTDRSISIFPNPCSGKFAFQCEDYSSNEDARWIVSDVLGRQLLCGNVTRKNGLIKTSVQLPDNYPPGVYILRVLLPNGSSEQKIVVER